MSRRTIFILVAILALVAVVWRSQLVKVSDPHMAPRALSAIPTADREPLDLDVVLPLIPVGMKRMRSGDGVMLIHYWAPWAGHALDQAMELDSLRRDSTLSSLDVTLVTFEPFPSVARYVARHRLGLHVLLDGQHALRRALPCPSLPYTYVLDREGRVAVSQEGLVRWNADSTRATLIELLREARRIAPSRAG